MASLEVGVSVREPKTWASVYKLVSRIYLKMISQVSRDRFKNVFRKVAI